MSSQLDLKTLELEQARSDVEDLAANLLSAQEEERRRIARDLHDGVVQQLAVLSIELAQLEDSQSDKQSRWAEKVGVAHSRVQMLLTEIRELSHRLHPSSLEHLGLLAALQRLVADFEAQERMTVICEFCELSNAVVPLSIATGLYRIAQEALANSVKHASLPGRQLLVEVTLTQEDDVLRLTVKDNGPGIDGKMLLTAKGIGLGSMRERAKSMGGTLSLLRVNSGGTVVLVKVPVRSDP